MLTDFIEAELTFIYLIIYLFIFRGSERWP